MNETPATRTGHRPGHRPDNRVRAAAVLRQRRLQLAYDETSGGYRLAMS